MQVDKPQRRKDAGIVAWRPLPSRGGLIGMGATLFFVACSAAGWAYSLGRPIALDSFVAVVACLAGLLLALVAGVLTYGYYSMRYLLGERELIVSWLWTREIVPLGSIDNVYRGSRLGKRAGVEGLAWPGYYVGSAAAEGLDRARFYGTSADPAHALLLGTTTDCFALTPRDLGGFRDRLLERLEALPEEEIEAERRPRSASPWLFRLSVLRDGVVLGLLGAALVALLCSFGYLSAGFPDLPELIPLHYNAMEQADFLRPRGEVFRLPILGLLLLGANAVVAAALHAWQRDAGRLLAAATVLVELVMLVAVVRVVQ